MDIVFVLFWLFSILITVVLTSVITKKTGKTAVIELDSVNSLLSDILEVNFNNNSLSSASENILLVLKKFYNIDYVTILIYHSDSSRLDVIASNVGTDFLSTVETYCRETLISMKGKNGYNLVSDGGVLSYPSASERDVSFSSFTPLTHKGVLIGGILLENNRDNVHSESLSNSITRMELFDKIFNSTALVLQNVLQTEKLIQMTSTDQLTGVYNRRYIDMTLVEQLHTHQNLGLPCTVVIFDIDHFKKFNDTYGHAFGDVVLQEVAKFMKRGMKSKGWVARYGGEEFILFFPRSKVSEVEKYVDKLRDGLSKLNLTDGNVTVSVTASFGIASFPNAGFTSVDLVTNADKALYDAKRNGRNMVMVYDANKELLVK